MRRHPLSQEEEILQENSETTNCFFICHFYVQLTALI